MPPVVLIDERWLLDIVQNLVPGDPDVTDYGALAASVARHRHEVMGTLVYPAARHRAAALLHCLARVPALEHSNELFAAQVAYAYLYASGIQVKVGSQEAITLVADVVEGRRDVREVAEALKNWG
ncbi:fic family toxin-antitoxin system, toxin component [Streptomyces sp. NBC_00989]|uniref:fic family toxin-antitoxin system, toxin component n=1 Tax=Streptomyces sp. NBC_00989 TaxID=2903705 RepID=UPI002F90C418|nr:fic family toxin-antitoxin system, toxin component [Streptomyces sp. NBC_00989]